MNQARFQKQQREKARREKAAAKSSRRELRKDERATSGQESSPLDQDAVIAELSALHQRYEDGAMELDEFIAAREALTEQLTSD